MVDDRAIQRIGSYTCPRTAGSETAAQIPPCSHLSMYGRQQIKTGHVTFYRKVFDCCLPSAVKYIVP